MNPRLIMRTCVNCVEFLSRWQGTVDPVVPVRHLVLAKAVISAVSSCVSLQIFLGTPCGTVPMGRYESYSMTWRFCQ